MKKTGTLALIFVLLYVSKDILHLKTTPKINANINYFKISKSNEGCLLLSYYADLENEDEIISNDTSSEKHLTSNKFNSTRYYETFLSLKRKHESQFLSTTSILTLHCVYRL